MNVNELRELIESIDRSGITHFEFEQDGVKVCLKKETGGAIVPALQPERPLPVLSPVATSAVTGNAVAPEVSDQKIHIVTSPMVGVFYESPQPGAPPFVRPGDPVRKGQVLCILEAMKLMNEVQSELDGTIIEVVAQNETMVEYGQPLFKIRE